jgi:hypothetical protein
MRGHSTVHQLIEIYHNMCLSFILEDEYDSDVSSANNRERLWISSVISLIYNMNSKGPNTDLYTFNFLLDNSLIYKYQSGFMRGHSTAHQLIEIYHNICLSFENREIVFCDKFVGNN